MNITEDYVSFEVAKLLKEKGFDERCRNSYNLEGKFYVHTQWHYPITTIGYVAPTHQMAMKWLRKTHNLFIGVNTVIGSDKNWGYEVFIQKQEVPIPSKILWDRFNSYEQAVDVAIKYCLENLI